MPLNKLLLKQQLEAIDPNNDDIIGKMVEAIDAYIKSATIIVAAGIPVATAGTPAAQTGATTAPATATIS